MALNPILALRKQVIAAKKSRLTRAPGPSSKTAQRLAEILGLSRPRLNLSPTGKATEFALEALQRIAIRADLSIRLKLTRPYSSD